MYGSLHPPKINGVFIWVCKLQKLLPEELKCQKLIRKLLVLLFGNLGSSELIILLLLNIVLKDSQN